MLFNSIDFAIFLPIIFILYWLIPNHKIKLQNFCVLISSYIFYGWWDYRFLLLIGFSSLMDFLVALKMSKTDKSSNRKFLVSLSVVVNLGFLGLFKYYNFFIENFVETFSFFGYQINADRLNIILPVGISFYTFQTMSYTIDVYRKKMKATTDILSFFSYVSFFPQLVAGPIERAINLLPQFNKKRVFNYDLAIDGMRQILWGLFKKIVIADNCAIYVNDIFTNYDSYSSSTLLLGGLFFTFQVYGDFSGYSDIAIGVAKLFGFKLMNNFSYPFFSRDVSEFWRRWHISLSVWFKNYVYLTLGGSKGSLWIKIRNVFTIFILSGFWHGANWTYIVWGLVNAIYVLPQLLNKNNRLNLEIVAKGKLIPNFKEGLSILFTFVLTIFAMIIFRSENLKHAFYYIVGIFSTSLLSFPVFYKKGEALITLILIICFLIVEWFGRSKDHPLQILCYIQNSFSRKFAYIVILMLLYVWGGQQQEFIYFQF